MEENKNNKIDKVIDEVLESKRLKQASFGVLKFMRVLAILAIPSSLAIAITMVIDYEEIILDVYLWIISAGVAFIVFLILNNQIAKIEAK